VNKNSDDNLRWSFR